MVNSAKPDLTREIKPKFPEKIPTSEKIIEGIGEGETVQSIRENGIFNGMQLLSRKIESIPTLVDPIFPKEDVIAIAGSSDAGKSSFLRQLAVSVALDKKEFLGFPINSVHKRAIYVSTEDGEDAISFLLHKANLENERPIEDYERLEFVFDTTNLLSKLDKMLSEAKRDVVVIDAFSDLYGKSMNDSNQVRTFLNDYAQLVRKHKCLIIFLHHTGKRTEEREPSKHNLLGSQGFEAKMRMVAELRPDNVDPAKRHLCIVKGNYLDKEYKTESFVLLFNENLQFENTGERKPFDELKSTNKIESVELVKKLKSEGKTQEEIAKETGISQPTVSRYLKQ